MTTDCLIALGGNRGQVAGAIADAVAQLSSHPQIEHVCCSSLYLTAPVGANAADPFLNAAARLQTSLSPQELLEFLQSLETAAGRERTVRWGPRPLDLDLILFGDRTVATETLTVPHPACWYRRFVLDPAAEIAADMVHPVLRATVGELRDRLLERPMEVVLVSEDPTPISQLMAELQPRFAEVSLRSDARAALETAEPALVICLEGGESGRPESARGWRRIVDLTGDGAELLQEVTDILTSALDEPERQPQR